MSQRESLTTSGLHTMERFMKGEAVNYQQPPRMPIDMSETHDDTTLDGCNINMPPLSDISLAGSEINVV
ncbi:uncharacterized protein TNIN_484421 [Trichonephila inaurata madagascariensis]|uniref:Uncharacterized protein n=1 Tax=Trichonephila inaurata madagascariensis TaxID=2747483 RepID=A0A8X6YG33_9ARAC|nr:uncharacterized protein TNIN_272051 [Trichonephila inaurata madagascariensis]GFY70215.1 uncharacterized protein TNIN_484421 [Trichonephila inaurata madagascariensis]